MTRPPRFMQDAVIGMAILVVILALWRLHSHPKLFGALGPWAQTNIFGASTLSLIPQAGQGRGKIQPLTPLTASGASTHSTVLPGTNSPAAPASNGLGVARSSTNSPRSTHLVSTNLLNTNGPVTVIAVAPSDLVETPPGIAAAVNVPEAAALNRRLGEVSAKGGDIQISLSWNNYNDLDLHCIEPGGGEIWFGNRRSARTGGELDIDQNAYEPYNESPVENIYWPFGAAPSGLYRIFVVDYAPHGGADPTAFILRTVVQGKTNFFRSTVSYSGMRERNLICNLRYDPANPNAAQRIRFVQ
jgi:hypothetical protein